MKSVSLINKFFFITSLIINIGIPKKPPDLNIYNFLVSKNVNLKESKHIDLNNLLIKSPSNPNYQIYYMINNHPLKKYNNELKINALENDYITFFLHKINYRIFYENMINHKSFVCQYKANNSFFDEDEKILLVFKIVKDYQTTFDYKIISLSANFCHGGRENKKIYFQFESSLFFKNIKIFPHWIIFKKIVIPFHHMLFLDAEHNLKNQTILTYVKGLFLKKHFSFDTPDFASSINPLNVKTSTTISISKTYKIVTFKPLKSFSKNLTILNNLSLDEIKLFLLKKYNFFGFKLYPKENFKWNFLRTKNWLNLKLNIKDHNHQKYLYSFTIFMPNHEEKNNKNKDKQIVKKPDNKEKIDPNNKREEKVYLWFIFIPILLIFLLIFFYYFKRKK